MSRAQELCRDCVALLDDALSRPPTELSREVDRVEQQLAGLRDHLIDQWRNERKTATAAQGRAALDTVNAALSLVVGVEYPAAGVQRGLLRQARAALHALLDGRLDADGRR
jgi:hypothetical protein